MLHAKFQSGLKNRCVSANMPKKIGSVGQKIFLFFYKFLFNKIRSKMFLWVTFHSN